MKKIISIISIALCSVVGAAQSINGGNIIGQGEVETADRLNTITTAVPFLSIAPDSRAGGMGDAGVATSPDVNSLHWNAAKLAFIEKDMGFAVSYTPWLRQLVPDINLSYLTGYKRLDKMSAIAGSMKYFSLGNIQFTDQFGNNTIQFNPNEFALDVAYSRLLADNVSGGIALRYIYSNLTGGTAVGGADTKAGQAIAVDVSAYWQSDKKKFGDKKVEFAAGVNVSNMGNKMSYSSTAKQDFLPINLRIGPRVTIEFDKYNSLTFTVDINKLMVPTPPIYAVDSAGAVIFEEGIPQRMSGEDPDRFVASGMFGSFSDAPGNPVRVDGEYVVNENGEYQIEDGSVLREELREIMYSVGMEYWYADQFAVRAGYFYENQLKGNRKFFSLGAALKYQVFELDFAYLIPAYFDNSTQRSPLDQTLRFTLSFDFDAFSAQNDDAGSK